MFGWLKRKPAQPVITAASTAIAEPSVREILAEMAPDVQFIFADGSDGVVFVAYPYQAILPLMQMIIRLNSSGWMYEVQSFKTPGWTAFKLTKMIT